jgi:DUF971 family protein
MQSHAVGGQLIAVALDQVEPLSRQHKRRTSMPASQVTVSFSGDELIVTVEDGTARAIDVGTLWAECRSAAARRRRIEGTHLPAPRNLKITETSVVGHYGLHIVFSSDPLGGVFPWPMLIALSRRPQMHDFIVS